MVIFRSKTRQPFERLYLKIISNTKDRKAKTWPKKYRPKIFMDMSGQDAIYRQILRDKIARPHRKPFGLFYPLETCVSSYFFIHRTLLPGKIYSVKK